jgi:hypothetical protein
MLTLTQSLTIAKGCIGEVTGLKFKEIHSNYTLERLGISNYDGIELLVSKIIKSDNGVRKFHHRIQQKDLSSVNTSTTVYDLTTIIRDKAISEAGPTDTVIVPENFSGRRNIIILGRISYLVVPEKVR